MKIISTILSATVALSLITSIGIASDHSKSSGHEWGYTGHNSPESWGTLFPKNKMCGIGKNQSPINITTTLHMNLDELKVEYTGSSKNIINNGHTVQVNMGDGNIITLHGMIFSLKQFHFHTPSENRINGKAFPLEAHFVHLDKDGNIAVVAVMFEEGKENKVLAKIWDKMPMKDGVQTPLVLKNIASKLLPTKMEHYHFNGSLTTPPCTEGVRWIVLKNPVTVSKEQVKKFLDVMKHENNRPIQPINARVVVE
ncbi:MAG: carbonic anhydrase family protein [Sulfurovum sp.]|nr:carbonic anhydrase family protein [Sulfurovaceae bacterium]